MLGAELIRNLTVAGMGRVREEIKYRSWRLGKKNKYMGHMGDPKIVLLSSPYTFTVS